MTKRPRDNNSGCRYANGLGTYHTCSTGGAGELSHSASERVTRISSQTFPVRDGTHDTKTVHVMATRWPSILAKHKRINASVPDWFVVLQGRNMQTTTFL